MVAPRLVFFCFLLCCAPMARAGSLQVEVRSDSIVAGLPFDLVITARGNEIGELALPKITGAVIDGFPFQSAERMEFRNGRSSAMRLLAYKVTPEKAGELIVPPFSAEIDGEHVESESLHLTVLGYTGPPIAKRESLDVNDLFFSVAKTDKQEVFQGERVDLTLEIWILNENPYPRPSEYTNTFPITTGFYAVPRTPQKAPERNGERNGHKYIVVPFQQTLYPTSAGDLEIGPWTWDGVLAVGRRAGGFPLKTEPLKVHVKPLPPSPAEFSGSIGRNYKISATLSDPAGIQGVPVTLTLSVRGDGNPGAVGLPKIPSFSWAELGEPEQRIPANQGQEDAAYDFVYKLVPTTAGFQTVPPVIYSFFNPDTASYETAQSEPLPFRVRAAGEQEDHSIIGAAEADPDAKRAIAELLPIVTEPGPLTRTGDCTLVTLFAAGAPAIAYALFAVYLTRQRRFSQDRKFARAYYALQRAESALADVPASANSTDLLYLTTTGFLADEFNLPETGMTSVDAEKFLHDQNIPADIAIGFARILKSCERARYAATPLSTDELHALAEGAKVSMGRLDHFLKHGEQA